MISIIIPIFNRDYCLPRCLDSVLRQSFTNWECILIDDGSTDRSLSVCYSYTEKDPRFRVYSQPNRGVSVARNKGLQNARGKYIAFIDSDDWVEPDYLRLLFESAGKGITPLCSMDIQCIDGCKMKCSVQDHVYRMDGDVPELLSGNLFGVFAGPVCKLYDRSIIETYCLRFQSGVSWGEDLIFNCTYLQYIDHIKGLPFHLYHVIRQKESLSVNAKFDFFLTDVNQKLWQSVSGLFSNRGIDSPFLNDYYISLFYRQMAGVRYVHDRLSWMERYERMNYLIQSANRKILKKYRFKNIHFLMSYYRLPVLFFALYEVYFFYLLLRRKITNK